IALLAGHPAAAYPLYAQAELIQPQPSASPSPAQKELETIVEKGVRAANAGDNESAVKHFSQVIAALNSNDKELYGLLVMRAASLRELGRFDRALEDCAKAIDLRPNAPWAYFTRGEINRRRGRYAEAVP